MYAPRKAAALAAVAALAVAGCKSGKAPEPAKAGAAKPAAGAPAKPGQPATAARPTEPARPTAKPAQPARPAEPATAAPVRPAPMPGAAGDGRVEEVRRERQILEQQRQTLIAHYTEMGDQAFAASRFEDAEKYYGDVLDLDPTHQRARMRRQEIGAILGRRGMTEGQALDTAVESYRVRVQQARQEVARLAEEAGLAEKTGNHEAAIQAYDKALVIANLFDATADFQPSVKGLMARREAARDNAARSEDAKRRRQLREAGELARLEAAAQRAARRERTSQLFRQANQAMESGNYQTARNLAEEILRNDPQNQEAKRLRHISLDALNSSLEDGYRKAILDEWKHVFQQLADAYTPQTDDYTFPQTWTEIQQKRSAPVLSGDAKMVEDPQDRAVRNRLDSIRTTVSFDNTTLVAAAEYLATISGTNIIIHPSAKEGKSDADLTIEKLTLDTPVSISQILNLVTSVSSLAWTVDDGVVQITTPEAARGTPVVQLYDVKDLATPINNFPGDEVNLDPRGEAPTTEEAKEPVPEFLLEQIVELIQNNVDRTVWEEGGSVESLPPGTLVIKAPAATHAHVQQLLDGLRGAGGLQVSIETRFVTVTDNFLQEVGVDLRGLGDQSGGVGVAGKGGIAGPGGITVPVTFDDLFFGSAGSPSGIGSGNDTGIFYNMNSDGDIRARFEHIYDTSLGKPGVITNLGGLSFQGTMIDDTQLEVILRAVEKNDRSTVVIAPRLTAYNGQRANVSVLNQISYISDFDVEIAQAAQIGDPIVQTLRDGVILDLRPVVSADRRFITMELRPTVAILTRPIATFQTTLANGPPVTIQLPELAVQRVRTTVTMPDGGTLLLGGLKFFEERRLESTIPWLDKIPVATFFVSRKGTYLEKRNLLVLIRARILRPEENEPTLGSRL